jgi:hypothetical protein
LNVAAAPALTECAVISVASRSITTQPVNNLPATHSHGKPPGRNASNPPHMPAHHRPDLAGPGQAHVIDAVQGPPGGGVRRRIAEHPHLVGEQVDVGQGHRPQGDRDRQTDQDHTPVPPPRALPRREQRTQRGRQPHPVSAPAQQHRTRMTDQTSTRDPHQQLLVPTSTLAHQEGAPESLPDLI